MWQCKFEEDNDISNENPEECKQEEGNTSEYESEESPSDDSENDLEEVCLYLRQFSFISLSPEPLSSVKKKTLRKRSAKVELVCMLLYSVDSC